MRRPWSRRALLGLGGGIAAAGLLGASLPAAAPPRVPSAPRPGPGADVKTVTLTARRRDRRLPGTSAPTPTLGYADDTTLPVIRMRRGQWLRAVLRNQLAEHTTVHWHGLRIANAMDGVPYLTQAPVLPGESFVYEIEPPDCGTFFFHPHCDTVGQLGRGLAGVLIVEGDAAAPFDADLVCAYRDWRIDDAGRFTPLMTDKGASSSGTFGRVRTVNDAVQPVLAVPANGDVRVRFLNLDMTRLIDLGVEGGTAWVIATDGNPIDPVPLDSWRLGPAMRLDLALRAPAEPGGTLRLMNYYAAAPVPMAALRAEGPPLARPAFAPVPLRRSGVPVPAAAGALSFPLQLGAAGAPALPPDLAALEAQGLKVADALCLSSRTFWALNGQPWPSLTSGHLPPPLARFERGRTYRVEIANLTPHPHPIHLHGHSFQVLSSSQRRILPHLADTTLVLPKERVTIAFVADNPGDWMLHCHIVEHQETGMMGYVRIA
ncbi:MAG: multicopper oxidase family protein [Dongiaceae bacterium]